MKSFSISSVEGLRESFLFVHGNTEFEKIRDDMKNNWKIVNVSHSSWFPYILFFNALIVHLC